MLNALLVFGATAFAGTPGWYDPQAVAAGSAQFSHAAEGMSPAFEQAEGQASRYAAALRAWETSLDLLVDKVSPDELDAYAAARTLFFRRHAVINQFAEDEAVAFDAAFRAALDRALVGRGYVACTPPSGGLRMTPGGSRDKPACEGEDHTEDVLNTVDTDPKLKAAIDELLARPWPQMKFDLKPAAALGEGVVLDAYALFSGGAGHALAAIDQHDAEAREPFEAALEGSPSAAELKALEAQAMAVTKLTSAARAGVARDVLAAIQKLADKHIKKGEPGYAWCVRPEEFGGCMPPADQPATGAITEDKKVAKALAKADALRQD